MKKAVLRIRQSTATSVAYQLPDIHVRRQLNDTENGNPCHVCAVGGPHPIPAATEEA
jgi:hypothetical protein